MLKSRLYRFYFVVLLGVLSGGMFSDIHASAEASGSGTGLLIMGARPWDENIRGLGLPGSTYFMDFRDDGHPDPMPETMHVVDWNNMGEMVNFSKAHKSQFGLVLVDWVTEKHIRNSMTLIPFNIVFQTGGAIVVPVIMSRLDGQEFNLTEYAATRAKALFQDRFYTIEVLTASALQEKFREHPDFATMNKLYFDPSRHYESVKEMAKGTDTKEPLFIVATRR